MLTGFWAIALLVAFGRIGLGLVMPSLNLSGMNSVPGDLVPYAAGTLNFIRMTGASIGVSTLAIIIDYRTIGRGADLLTTQTPDNLTTSETLNMLAEKFFYIGLNQTEGSLAAVSYYKALLSLKAQELAFQEGHIALCYLFMLGVIATIFLFRRRQNS